VTLSSSPRRTSFALIISAAIAEKPSASHPQGGGRLFVLPKYSPDLNPIEQVFAKLKTLLRRAEARTLETICATIGDILGRFSPKECANYFKNAGYA
jgi:transposase